VFLVNDGPASLEVKAERRVTTDGFRRAIFMFAICLALLGASRAYASEVYPGCDAPPPPSGPPGARAFYVDPKRGDKANDGSKERPWRTLAEVLDPDNRLIQTKISPKSQEAGKLPETSGITPPVKGGDIIYLMSGDHGDVFLRRAVSEQFIQVAAAPGQKPVLSTLRVSGASHWLLRGLTVRSPKPDAKAGGALVDIRDNNYHGPVDNIIFEENEVLTPDGESWSEEQWASKPRFGVLAEGRCLTVSRNHIWYVDGGLGVGGENDLVEDNLIEKFAVDGIDMTASNLILRRNTIRDGRLYPNNPAHADGIQGWTVGGATNRNVTIDSNTIIKTGDRNKSNMQGISIFDGKWDGVRIVNNVVVGNHFHGVALFGVAHALVANNTVVPSDTAATWILVRMGKDKTPSTDVVVRNNVSGSLNVEAQRAEVDHNVAQSSITLDVDGRKSAIKVGTIDGNRVYSGAFVDLQRLDIKGGVFDLRPTAKSVLFQAGSSKSAPKLDIAGKTRRDPPDIGAYAH